MEMPSAGGISLPADRSGTFCLLASISTSAVALIHCSAAFACLLRFFLERNIQQQISISARWRSVWRIKPVLFSEWTDAPVCGQLRLVSTCWTAKIPTFPLACSPQSRRRRFSRRKLLNLGSAAFFHRLFQRTLNGWILSGLTAAGRGPAPSLEELALEGFPGGMSWTRAGWVRKSRPQAARLSRQTLIW